MSAGGQAGPCKQELPLPRADPVPASQNSTPAKTSTGPFPCTQSQAGDGGQERLNAAMPFCCQQPWVCFHCMSPVLNGSRICLQSNQDLKSRVSPLASTSWALCWPFPLKLPDSEILFWATQDSSLSMAGFFCLGKKMLLSRKRYQESIRQ